jgi:4-diphosphocytidyl-2-C-methyl-D-erythritol kinase
MHKQYESPAKVNLCLNVLGRREDGYHELAMAMQCLDLTDQVDINIESGQGVSVVCDSVSLGRGEQNIAARAAEMLLSEAQLQVKVDIIIKKNIPVAAGLGGGSSNAATVLMGLCELLNLGWERNKLMDLGAKLGADVPFFIYRSPAWATGIGTQLKKLPQLPDFACLLVNPRIAISTADIYQSLQLTKGGELANLPRFSAKTLGELCASLHNDLEAVTIPRYPIVREIKQLIMAEGALGSLMSGSGATVFGLFADFNSAQQAGKQIANQQDWFVYAANPI